MKAEFLTLSKYKNAFNCKKCPQSSKEDGCPAWWEQAWTDSATGEQVLQRGCGFSMAQYLMVEVVKAAYKPASEISQMKKEVVDGVERATVAVMEFHKAQEEVLSSGDLEGYNLDAHGVVRLDRGVDDSGSKDSRMDT
jgi:hypothetical protein